MLQPQTHGAGFAYYGLDACQLGFEQSASIPGQAVISTAAVRAAGAGDLVHKARPQKALERGVQSCRAHAEAAVGEIPRFLHDGISVLFAAGKSEEPKSAVRLFTPAGRFAARSPRVMSVRSMPRSAARRIAAVLMIPVPPRKRTRM